MLIKNQYPNLLIYIVLKNEVKWINHIKPFGPEKFKVLLILPCAGEKSTRIKKYKEVNKKVYCATTPRVIFTSSSVLSPKEKDLIPN